MTRIEYPLLGRPATLTTRRRNLAALAAIFTVSALVVGFVGTGSFSALLGPHALGVAFDIGAPLLGLWLGILIWLWARRRGKFDPFEPPTWISLNLYIQVVANVWLLQRDEPSAIPWLADNPGAYGMAVLLFGAGLTAMWLGYALLFNWLSMNKRFQPASQRTPRLGIASAIWVTGTAVAIFSTLSGTSTYLGRNVGAASSNYFYFMDMVTKTAAAILVINHFRRPTAAGRWWLVAVVGLSIGLGLFSGSKVFLLDILWLIMLIYYAKGKIPVRWPALLLITLVFLVPVVNTYRILLFSFDTGAGVGAPDRMQALGEAFGASVTQPVSSAVDASRDTFEKRQGSLLHISASAIYLHPRYLSFVGRQMAEFLAPQLIPRVFWPSKPDPPESLMRKTTIYTGAPFETSLSTMGQIADSYRAAGWLGTALWLWLLGAFAAWLYIQGPYRNSFPGTVFSVTVLSQILRYDGEMLFTFIRLLQFATLLWVVTYWGLFFPVKSSRTETVAPTGSSMYPVPSSETADHDK